MQNKQYYYSETTKTTRKSDKGINTIQNATKQQNQEEQSNWGKKCQDQETNNMDMTISLCFRNTLYVDTSACCNCCLKTSGSLLIGS